MDDDDDDDVGIDVVPPVDPELELPLLLGPALKCIRHITRESSGISIDDLIRLR